MYFSRINLLDLLFPKYCLKCHSVGFYICPRCKNEIEEEMSFKRYKNNRTDINVFSMFPYDGVLKMAIAELKYNNLTTVTEEIEKLIAAKIEKISFLRMKETVLVPVPLSLKKERFRGFNQSHLLSSNIAKQLEVMYLKDLLIKVRETKPQMSLTKTQREGNLSGVFLFNKKYNYLSKQKKIVIFDDVVTSGATLLEIKNILQQNGFNSISALTLLRQH